MDRQITIFIIGGILLVLGHFIGIFPLLFGGFLTYAAIQDWRKHEVSNVLLASLWIIAYCAWLDFTILSGSFALLFLIVAIGEMWKKRTLMGWADVLGLPPYFTLMLSYGTIGIASIILALLLFDVSTRKKGGPLFPFLMISFWVTVVFSLLH